MFLNADDATIKEVLSSANLKMTRKKNSQGQTESVEVVDQDDKPVWYMNFDWYRKSQAEDSVRARQRKSREEVAEVHKKVVEMGLDDPEIRRLLGIREEQEIEPERNPNKIN